MAMGKYIGRLKELHDRCCQWALDAFIAGGTKWDSVYLRA